MTDKHLSTQFDSELNGLTLRVLQMGRLVQAQIGEAVHALSHFDAPAADHVIEVEGQIDLMEVEIDRALSLIIVRRQPTAGDLRLLIAISKTTANLERMGDEAEKMARMVKSIMENATGGALPVAELSVACELALGQLRKVLSAFARLDITAAVAILRDDDLVDVEFGRFLRKLIASMMEDPLTISASLDLLFLAKSIERIGDHAKNIAESIIYIVKGTDVRHTSLEQIESATK
jgi:phosphate transport system protein